MAETYVAKIVTVSRPYLVKEGNSWVSTCVYKQGDKYYCKNAIPPALNHGPWEIGEEVEVSPSGKDEEAPDWMIEIYNNPKDYKRITLRAKEEEKEKEREENEEDDFTTHLTTFINIVVAIAVAVVIGIILITFIKGA